MGVRQASNHGDFWPQERSTKSIVSWINPITLLSFLSIISFLRLKSWTPILLKLDSNHPFCSLDLDISIRTWLSFLLCFRFDYSLVSVSIFLYSFTYVSCVSWHASCTLMACVLYSHQPPAVVSWNMRFYASIKSPDILIGFFAAALVRDIKNPIQHVVTCQRFCLG
jgi:hypothetical protein